MQPSTITDVRTIGVTVTDQDAALAFFVGTLGFDKRLDAPMSPGRRWIEVAPTGATTSIALNGADGDTKVAADTGIRFTVPDAEAEYASMHARGVQVGELLRLDGVPPMFTSTTRRQPLLHRRGVAMTPRTTTSPGTDQGRPARRHPQSGRRHGHHPPDRTTWVMIERSSAASRC